MAEIEIHWKEYEHDIVRIAIEEEFKNLKPYKEFDWLSVYNKILNIKKCLEKFNTQYNIPDNPDNNIINEFN